MGRRNRLADLLIYAMLQTGTMFGLPLRPEDIEAITRQLQGTVAVEQELDEDGSGEPP